MLFFFLDVIQLLFGPVFDFNSRHSGCGIWETVDDFLDTSFVYSEYTCVVLKG